MVATISNARAVDDKRSAHPTFLERLFRPLAERNRKPSIVKLKNDRRPFLLYASPSKHSSVRRELHPQIQFVKLIKKCEENWCYVRSGPAIGWLNKDRFDLRPSFMDFVNGSTARPETSESPQEVKIALPVRKGRAPAQKATPPVSQNALVNEKKTPKFTNIPLPDRSPMQFRTAPAPTIPTAAIDPILHHKSGKNETQDLEVKDIAKRKYGLSQLDGEKFVSIREDRRDDAKVVGVVPFFATDIEALGICINEWCLVRRGQLQGWIERRHLAE